MKKIKNNPKEELKEKIKASKKQIPRRIGTTTLMNSLGIKVHNYIEDECCNGNFKLK